MRVCDCGAREDEQQAHFAAWALHCLWMFVSVSHSMVPTLKLRTYRHFK